MKKYSGFTLIEVMVSIFIFSSGMMAFMAYHARANSMIYDTESSQIAHALGLNLAEEINSMTPERLIELCDNSGITYDAIYQDANLSHFFNQEGTFVVGPFDSWGQPGAAGQQYMFYRMLKINKYTNMTDTAYVETSQYNRLRHIEVIISWPMKGYGSLQCNSEGKVGCNYLHIPLVKFVDIVTP
ncbi:MAG TPA: prepilin-type N-terminal cleavage/methylation domain-containing protein [bacterium]|nr:prepilin-type N-terminal cleavage/methylation domain-containing protein [bacterium]